MQNPNHYEELITQLGRVNDRLEQLENVDYMTATYKGYSSDGSTVDEIEDEIKELRQQARTLERELEEEA